jgi:hypothetical protein
MAKITSLTELTEVADDDLLVVVDKSDTSMADSGTDKKVQKVNLLKGLVPENGWTPAGETWTYVSTDDPTGVIKINANVTSKYSEGMRFKMTNGGNTIYAIITKMGTYGGDEAGYTYITFLHEIDPSDNLALHLMANSAITSPYYSTQKAPQGFPLSPNKWTIKLENTSDIIQNNPTNGTWYNLGSLSLQVPIGEWNLSYSVTLSCALASTGTIAPYVALSTSPSMFSDNYYKAYLRKDSLTRTYDNVFLSKIVTLTSKTTYYLIAMTATSSTDIAFRGSQSNATRIIATCAYL